MTDQSQDRSQFCKSIGFAFTKDGRTVELRFLRNNDKTAHVPCDFDHLATIVQKIEEAMGAAWKLQKQALGGADPQTFYPLSTRKVTNIQATHAPGQLVLTLVTDTGLRLNLAFGESVIQSLIDNLQRVKQSPPTKKPVRH